MSGLRAAILQGGEPRAVEGALLEGGAGASEVVDPVTGEFPLHIATLLGQEGTVRRLLRSQADVNARMVDGSRATALHFAAGQGHEALVRLLLQGGAELGPEDIQGRTPEAWARDARQDRCEALLAERRRQAGLYEAADIPRIAEKTVTSAVEGFSSWLRGCAPPGAAGQHSDEAPPPAAPPPAAPPPAALTPEEAAEARRHQDLAAQMDSIRASVADVESAAPCGHLKGARGWQDDLTKAACQLDGLELGGLEDLRSGRRELLKSIDRAANLIDTRIAGTSRALAECAAVVEDVAFRFAGVSEWQQRSGGEAAGAGEWRGILAQAAAKLDTIECSSEAQRTQRRAQLTRIEELEAEIDRLERGGLRALPRPRTGVL